MSGTDTRKISSKYGHSFLRYAANKQAPFRSVPFRLEVAAYFDKHANAEAKLHLLAQCITFHGSEGSISSV